MAEREMVDIKGEGIPTDVKCEKCGKPMVIRLGRNGQFLACTGYPECDGTSDLPPELAAKYSQRRAAGAGSRREQNCEKCGKPMAVKRGRFGYFLACTGYPECRNTKKIVMKEGNATAVGDQPLEEKCPECGNHLVLKHGRFGQFTACSNYPKCKYVKRETLGIPCPEKGCTGEIVVRRTRFKARRFTAAAATRTANSRPGISPSPNPAPIAAHPILLEKYKKSGPPLRHCPNESCKYEMAVA